MPELSERQIWKKHKAEIEADLAAGVPADEAFAKYKIPDSTAHGVWDGTTYSEEERAANYARLAKREAEETAGREGNENARVTGDDPTRRALDQPIPEWNGKRAPESDRDPRKVLDRSRLGDRRYYKWAEERGLLAAADRREAAERLRERGKQAAQNFQRHNEFLKAEKQRRDDAFRAAEEKARQL